ncbi:UNVERIFIED_CONTAM: hypothetical protein FKN15_069539 [Acipenser sinensis]
MAAPILASRAGSVNNTGTGTGSGTSISSNNNNKTAPSFPELDFRSGARIEELNKLILDFSKNDQREYDDQRALEIHTAKDFIFSMLGEDHTAGPVQEDYSAHFLLGLIDDLQHCLVNKMCPNYFIPQCNMLEHLSDETVVLHARKLSSVRSDPTEHLRTAIEQLKAANRLTMDLQRRGSSSSIPSPLSDGGETQPDDRLAKKLQQLVTENPGKSISVFINPDDVTRPHFRIDDKFF